MAALGLSEAERPLHTPWRLLVSGDHVRAVRASLGQELQWLVDGAVPDISAMAVGAALAAATGHDLHVRPCVAWHPQAAAYTDMYLVHGHPGAQAAMEALLADVGELQVCGASHALLPFAMLRGTPSAAPQPPPALMALQDAVQAQPSAAGARLTAVPTTCVRPAGPDGAAAACGGRLRSLVSIPGARDAQARYTYTHPLLRATVELSTGGSAPPDLLEARVVVPTTAAAAARTTGGP